MVMLTLLDIEAKNLRRLEMPSLTFWLVGQLCSEYLQLYTTDTALEKANGSISACIN